jgi:GT2 family glycosyltransferase
VSIRVSFVVPVRNDAVRLDTCLRSIRAGHGAEQVEVVVVDNGSTDRSPEVARAFGARVLVLEHLRVSELRNRGASQASGDVLAFVDADNEIGPGWLDAVVENFEHPKVGATGARYRAPADGTWVQCAYDLLRGETRGRADVSWLASGNLAVRRSVFHTVGGFDTSLDTCEDVDLCHRIGAAGWRILGDARLTSVHHGDPSTLRDLFKSELWRGRDNLRVSFRRPLVWAAIPSAILPVVDAALLGAGAIGVFGWFAGWTPGLLATSAALSLLVGGALLKVLRAVARDARAHGLGVLQAVVVACVYDVARALALLTRAPHRSTRPKAETASAS